MSRTLSASARTGAVRVARAEVARPSRDWSGWCLKFVRTMLGLPAVAPSAIEAWEDVDTADRHRGLTPPDGVPVFWDIGPHGHVALSAGNGRCYSTDIRRTGKVDLVPIAEVQRRWGARYLGWSETLGPFRVYTPPAKKATRPKPDGPDPAGRHVTVRRGDTVSGLVPAGVAWAEVWRDARNSNLRRARGRPEFIRPGDRLWVP